MRGVSVSPENSSGTFVINFPALFNLSRDDDVPIEATSTNSSRRRRRERFLKSNLNRTHRPLVSTAKDRFSLDSQFVVLFFLSTLFYRAQKALETGNDVSRATLVIQGKGPRLFRYIFLLSIRKRLLTSANFYRSLRTRIARKRNFGHATTAECRCRSLSSYKTSSIVSALPNFAAASVLKK